MTDQIEKHNVEEFIRLVKKGMECWVQAGEIAAKSIEGNPNFIDEVCDTWPDISPETVRRFQCIGLKKLHPALTISEAPGMRRLRKMPYEIQCKYVGDPVELLVEKQDGWDVLLVDVRNLTPDQVSQVFDFDCLRTQAAQRAYIEGKKAKQLAPPVKADLPYRIVGKKLVVVTACTLDRKEMARLLADMEG